MEDYMILKYVAAAMLSTTLMTGASLAQTTTPNSAGTSTTNAAMHKEGEWRASKLVGVNVYNDNNDKIGDINDVILDNSGKVANVILGVGGFLGMGEHYVAVAYDKLKWSNEAPRATTASNTTSTANRPVTNVDSNARTTADGTARTTGAATTTADDRKANGYWYPDHAVYNATKDQLKAMPQFKY
jgi:sporulation protein YlmC with PRC-barrel domain